MYHGQLFVVDLSSIVSSFSERATTHTNSYLRKSYHQMLLPDEPPLTNTVTCRILATNSGMAVKEPLLKITNWESSLSYLSVEELPLTVTRGRVPFDMHITLRSLVTNIGMSVKELPLVVTQWKSHHLQLFVNWRATVVEKLVKCTRTDTWCA